MNPSRSRATLAALAFAACAAAFAMPATAQDADEAAMQRDLSVVQRPLYDNDSGISGSAKRIGLDVRLDRRSGVYKIGEPLHITVQPEADAYITVLNVGSSGRVAVLLPNHHQRNTKVAAGSRVTIPAEGARWSIKVGGPKGVDIIKVIATSEPLSLREIDELARASEAQPLLTLGRSAGDVYRDLSVVAAKQTAVGVRNVLVRVVER